MDLNDYGGDYDDDDNNNNGSQHSFTCIRSTRLIVIALLGTPAQ